MGLYIILNLCLLYVVRCQSCGQSNFDITALAQTYIVGGSDANKGDFPWQVALYDGDFLFCGGTYVLDNFNNVRVITAAHCIPDKGSFTVVFGMHSITESKQYISVSSVIVHNRYSQRTMSNDIAVLGFGNLRPDDNAIASTFATPACLASRTHDNDEPAVVSGWGTITNGQMANILQYVEKPLLSRAECEKTQNSGYLDNTMICAGTADKDACQGDSGGPLVAYRNGHYELVGVVSWGFGCGLKDHPGVYADVSFLRSWIDQQLS